jgi:zinc transporter, ZIP family
MLPSAKSYLIDGGMSPRVASYTLIGCFLSGVVGITIVSRFIHHHMPSKVIDCDHNHEENEDQNHGTHASDEEEEPYEAADYEDTPLLSRTDSLKASIAAQGSGNEETRLRPDAPSLLLPHNQPIRETTRPALKPSFTRRVTSFIAGGKTLCDEDGPCHGYSDPCGQECFKVVSCSPTRGVPRRFLSTYRTMTLRVHPHGPDEERGSFTASSPRSIPPPQFDVHADRGRSSGRQFSDASGEHSHSQANGGASASDFKSHSHTETGQHHHHVPTNAFLSIGLQTSIAIALHKLPEGFITYATNHANPKLGFAVFMALFIHNITEGFAMALPLYLALDSRFHAIFWSALLGGVSQPAGAGIAALWFRAAQNHDMLPNEMVYGAMFAVTAGIMASVALQLFSESLGLTHNKNLCVAFAFVGMGILGLSNALTA